jgi:hypothetical protein
MTAKDESDKRGTHRSRNDAREDEGRHEAKGEYLLEGRIV